MTPFFFRSTLASIAVALALTTQAVAAAQVETPAAPASTHPLVLDAAAIEEAGIAMSTATERTVTDQVRAPGEVTVDAYSTALVSPRVASQVVARKVRLGDVVKAGQPLVVLSSVDVAETQGQLIVASQDWARVASLGPQAVSARRYNEALVQRDQARAKLKAYGMSDGQIASLVKRGSAAADGSFELLAPKAGRITTDSFVVGERIEPGRPLFTIVAESSVWVEAHLPPGVAEQAEPGAAVTILAHGSETKGSVIQRSHQTDEKTRTVDVRIQVPNEKDLLHPGELVEARIAVASHTRQLAVPAEAIVLLLNQPTVFVSGKKTGQFEPVAIEVGETHDGWTEVKNGLKAGTPYVSKGAFALKARILRSQLGED
ncbi:efflux RND transporter periplasmic adaptor subunit [Luteibacter yeojuensis]|uniref:Efflux RND transporter periplasmic adaptor subunit n=1 Tax=Luteibacter yeojuensis TaxID=345309 RepID=A0A7X5QSJ3_9GAMM|nr:efflux RND transporter periplasmic adaptor subunit [Luteibacter yeojuensis]NID14520.1 efflux RND transporter periplasmic adaptor subunit [Luteibacter yeojuensis]